jgi:hypothetical protein
MSRDLLFFPVADRWRSLKNYSRGEAFEEWEGHLAVIPG